MRWPLGIKSREGAGGLRDPETSTAFFFASIDVNECEDLNGPAALCAHGHCENTEGSYRCHCSPGYVAEPGPPHCAAKE